MSQQQQPRNTETKASMNITEKHVQTVLIAVIIGLLSWVGNSVTATNNEVIRLQEQIRTLNGEMTDLKSSAKDGNAAWSSMVANTNSAIHNLENRVTVLEQLQKRSR